MNLGVYIQIPFCQTKCTYCNFHTGVFSESLYSPYVGSVLREITEHDALYHAAGIRTACGCAPARVVDTVYIGGGTPSLLAPAESKRILDTLRGAFPQALEEVTLEADPETVSPEKADAWLAAGINRISLGSQSFNDRELIAAGRLHRRADIYAASDILRGSGIRNISFDLIAGLPHQTEESWRASVDELLSLAPEHISIYMLEIDEGSRLGREALSGGKRYSARSLPSDDVIADLYAHARERLATAGYHHYEISNWSRPGLESRHNLKYWLREPYFGFGAGAHSFDGQSRWANAYDPPAYAVSLASGRLPVEQLETLTPEQALDEELFLGLRLLAGIDVRCLEARYNLPSWPGIYGRIPDLARRGLVEWEEGRLCLAPGQLAISNEVFVELMNESSEART
jgi:oxygen-independent coproporphyrinogen III oxidase